MLIEFSFSNFRSIYEEQVFSFAACDSENLQETHTFSTGIEKLPRLLYSAMICGSNASGKSDLIKALQYMRKVVAGSATKNFQLEANIPEEPTDFKVTFLIKGVRYIYGFSMQYQTIVRESLTVYKSSRSQNWFKRNFDSETRDYIYDFGINLSGPKNLWKEETKNNCLFLSVAVQLNSEVLRPVFDWFINNLVIINEKTPINPQVSIDMLNQTDSRKKICDLLTDLDVSRADIEIMTIKFSDGTNYSESVFNPIEESDGTKNLLFLSGQMLETLKNGGILIIDEFDTRLHSLSVRELVSLFHRTEINTSGAQLLFTNHGTRVKTVNNLLRRDQVWYFDEYLA